MRNLQEQVKKAFCYQNLFWPITVWINCSNDLKTFANSRPLASNFKSFSQSLEQFFLTVGQILVTKYQIIFFTPLWIIVDLLPKASVSIFHGAVWHFRFRFMSIMFGLVELLEIWCAFWKVAISDFNKYWHFFNLSKSDMKFD